MLTPSKEVPSRNILRHLWHRLKRVYPNFGKIQVVGAGKLPYFQSGLFRGSSGNQIVEHTEIVGEEF